VLVRQRDTAVRGAENVPGDLSDAASLRAAVAHIDAVIHLAGVTHTPDAPRYFEVNTEGTKRLVRACEERGVKKFVYVSSRAACVEGGAYAHSKLLGELAVSSSSLDWIIVRVAEVYGSGGGGALGALVKAVRMLPIVPVLGARTPPLCPVHIDDAVQAISAAVMQGTSQMTYLIAGPEALAFCEVARSIARALGVRRAFLTLPLPMVRMFAFLASFFMQGFVRDQLPRYLCRKPTDISRTVVDLHFHPRPFSKGIRQVLANNP
jgi:NADH dehydrogenase